MEHITKALERCGYPSWTIKKMKEQQIQKEKTKEKKEKNTEKSKGMVTLPYVKGMVTLPYVKGMVTLPYVKGMVTLPYVKGVTEPVQWILKHHEIATSARPHQHTRRSLRLLDLIKTSGEY